MSNTQHTPTPWHTKRSTSGNVFLYAEGRSDPVAGVRFTDGGIDNAEHIIRCVNSHDALVALLKLIEQMSGEWLRGGMTKEARSAIVGNINGIARDTLKLAGEL